VFVAWAFGLELRAFYIVPAGWRVLKLLRKPYTRRFKGALAREEGITMGHLKESAKGGVFAGFNLFGGVPDTDADTLALAARSALIPALFSSYKNTNRKACVCKKWGIC
jgi:hypothetical protein